MSEFLFMKSFLYFLEDCSYVQHSHQPTMVGQFPEHLDLQLVLMVMRGSDLEAQVARGDRVKGGFRVRQKGRVGQVRGRRG